MDVDNVINKKVLDGSMVTKFSKLQFHTVYVKAWIYYRLDNAQSDMLVDCFCLIKENRGAFMCD